MAACLIVRLVFAITEESMKIHFKLSLLVSVFALATLPSLAQAQNSTDPLSNEVAGLRQSLQTLNNRLKTISDGLFSPDKKNEDNSVDSVRKVTTNLDLLTHAEERAEVLRKQLIELIEKETTYRRRIDRKSVV